MNETEDVSEFKSEGTEKRETLRRCTMKPLENKKPGASYNKALFGLIKGFIAYFPTAFPIVLVVMMAVDLYGTFNLRRTSRNMLSIVVYVFKYKAH